MAEALTIVHVYPNLLGTYGDAGNARVLAVRATLRGIPCQVIRVEPGQPVPRQAQIYLLGGGEDAKQTAAAQALRADGALVAAARAGAAVLGICAGYQLLGESFPGVGGVTTSGLGLLDVATGRLERRAVGNLSATAFDPRTTAVFGASTAELGTLIGFENHGGSTVPGRNAQPLGRVEVGIGNGDGTEGACSGGVVGTYLHGPALAINPALADWLLRVGLGTASPLVPIDDTFAEALRAHRRDVVLPATARNRRRGLLMRRFGLATQPQSGAAATLSGAGGGPTGAAGPDPTASGARGH